MLRKVLTICTLSLAGSTAEAQSYSTDFSRNFRYEVPHAFDTTRHAMSRVDGYLRFVISPGMHRARSDAEVGSERAEIGFDIEGAVFVRQSFRVRVPEGFRADERTMVSQIKQSRAADGLGSPPIAVYLNDGGRVKCNDYSSGRPSQNEVSTSRAGVRLDDGDWHEVVMDLVISDTHGLCRTYIDGMLVQSMTNIDTDQRGTLLYARLGPYRDAVPYSQEIHFDDWSVQSSRTVPAGILP